MSFETEAGILQYLQSHKQTQCINTVKGLTGGKVNYVYRGTITDPQKDHLGGQSTVIIKHAADHMAASAETAFSADRMGFEETILNILADLRHKNKKQPPQAGDGGVETKICKVPGLLYSDPKNHIVVLEDAGENAIGLREFITDLEQDPSPTLTGTIGSALGEFIARLHLYGIQHRSELYPDKMDNRESLEIGRRFTYEKIAMVMEECMMDQPVEDRKVIDEIAHWGMDRMMNDPETLAHGDFWSGNFLIEAAATSSSPASQKGTEMEVQHVYVIDWEVCRYGPAGMDVGLFMAEAFSLNKYIRPCEALMTSFIEAYCKTFGEKLTVLDLKTGLIHFGAHLMTWTSFRRWFPVDEHHDANKKEIVLIGAELMKRAWAEDWEWVRRETVFRGMVEYLKL